MAAAISDVKIERVVLNIAFFLALTGCFPLANRLAMYVHYYEPRAAGAQMQSYSCRNSGPPEDAKFTIGTNIFDVAASRPDWSRPNASIKLTWVLRPEEDLQIDPQGIVVMNTTSGQPLEVTSKKFIRRNLNATQTAEEMDAPIYIQGRTGRGWAERVWLLLTAVVGETKRFTVTFPMITLSGQAVDIPEVTFEDKSAMLTVIPFC